jgi:hypothetical protein
VGNKNGIAVTKTELEGTDELEHCLLGERKRLHGHEKVDP